VLKKILLIIRTNWLNLLGFYICMEIVMIVLAISTTNHLSWQGVLFSTLLAAPFLLFTYGLMFLCGVFTAIVLLDTILFTGFKLDALSILLIEWILIVPVFIYWAFEYHYWLWIALCTSFLITQIMRKYRIDKILVQN